MRAQIRRVQRHQRHEVPTGRVPGKVEPAGITTVRPDVLNHPGERGGDVLHMGGMHDGW